MKQLKFFIASLLCYIPILTAIADSNGNMKVEYNNFVKLASSVEQGDSLQVCAGSIRLEKGNLVINA
ncbi:MAG: hypothetical protein K2H47_04980 [Muribaculaceae bacterium]|nr:hypothetical protein [Muribaculaceae bacterium]